MKVLSEVYEKGYCKEGMEGQRKSLEDFIGEAVGAAAAASIFRSGRGENWFQERTLAIVDDLMEFTRQEMAKNGD